MLPLQVSNQGLNNFNPFAPKSTVAASQDSMNQSKQSSGRSAPAKTFNSQVQESSTPGTRARATNMLNNKFYGTGGRLDLYA